VKNNLNFPSKKYKNLKNFYDDYINNITITSRYINYIEIEKIADIILETIKANNTIYVAGNGGSNCIANHLQVDFIKGISTNTNLFPKVISLSNNDALASAISNDIDYNDIFSYQLKKNIKEKDLFIAISSSGNSKNIINGLKEAKKEKAKTILFCGFEGGESIEICDYKAYFPINNYGVVEDLSQIIMHIIAQFIRMKNLNNPTSTLPIF